MSFISKALKSGVAAKAFEIAKREAAKPENQAKAKEMFAKLKDKRASSKGKGGTQTTTPATTTSATTTPTTTAPTIVPSSTVAPPSTQASTWQDVTTDSSPTQL